MNLPFSTSAPSYPAAQGPVLVLETCEGAACCARREVNTSRFLIGSGSLCDLRLDDPAIPTLHSIVQLDGATAWLDSLVAAPPLVVNGQIRHSALLEDGDLIEIGTVRLIARCAATIEQPAPPQDQATTARTPICEPTPAAEVSTPSESVIPEIAAQHDGQVTAPETVCETESMDETGEEPLNRPLELSELFQLLSDSKQSHPEENELDAASLTAAELVELIEQEEQLADELEAGYEVGLPALLRAVMNRADELEREGRPANPSPAGPLHRLRLLVPEEDAHAETLPATADGVSLAAPQAAASADQSFQHEMELVVRQLSEISAELERRSAQFDAEYAKPLREMLAEQQDLSVRLDGLLKRMHQLAGEELPGDDRPTLRAVA